MGWAFLPPEGVPRAAWPFLVATSSIHAAYFYALGRAYGSGEFSLVYPIARGLGVALVPVAAVFLLDERPSPLGALGVLLVVAGIVGINVASAGPRRLMNAGTGWALVTGLSIAAYSLVDKAGVARLHPVPYIAILGVGMCLLLVPAMARRRAALAREWRTNWRTILVASTLQPHELPPRALCLPSLEGGLCGGGARDLHRALGAHRAGSGSASAGWAAALAAAGLVLAGVICVALARWTRSGADQPLHPAPVLDGGGGRVRFLHLEPGREEPLHLGPRAPERADHRRPRAAGRSSRAGCRPA